MKITLNWLKQYVDFAWSPSELADRLTMLGIEVEGVVQRAGDFEGVVVAEVVTRDKHPNADKLSVCKVNDGTGIRQIVCGATNFSAGSKVPLILPGATLPARPGEAPLTIKIGKIRGVESQGMMCSPMELGLATDSEGLLLLPDSAVVGQPFATHLGRSAGDVIYDLEITPNRPDLNSLIGIAREISVLTGNPLKIPAVQTVSAAAGVLGGQLQVRIDAPELCPRYTARVIRGVRVGPSPEWIRSALESIGVRSINNIVDVTNYVLMECGQPLHAFDLHLVRPGAGSVPTVVVRRAEDGETFVTLDGRQHTLTTENLLIADAERGVALAGVMGGLNSEIKESTVDVLLESAYFNPSNIRKTSKRLGLRTDASYRFERGADPAICDWASRRAVDLILATAGGQLVEGALDVQPSPLETKTITLSHAQAKAVLGVEIAATQQIDWLVRLGLRVVGGGDGGPSTSFEVPSFRVDLKREIDLVEEIARVYGVDKIPSTPPRGVVGSNPFDARFDELQQVRTLMAGLGLDEAQGQTLISGKDAALVVAAEEIVRLDNPLSADMDVLRPSLLPGLVASLKHNSHRKNGDVGLFEVGRVFRLQGGSGKVEEGRRLSVVMTGARSPGFWTGTGRDEQVDLHDLKGVLDEFFAWVGIRGVTISRRESSTGLFLESALISLGGKVPLGEFGQLRLDVAKANDLRAPVFLAELDLGKLLEKRNGSRSFKALPQFPSVRRDVAFQVAESVTHDAVLALVRQAKPANLDAVDVFDVFRGGSVPEGQKSLAYAFTYRHNERTLTDAEVNAAHEKVVESFRKNLAAVIR